MFEKPILSKEQRFVARRQQAAYGHIFKIHMQANAPNMGLEKYYLVTTNTTKWIQTVIMLSEGCLSSGTVPFKCRRLFEHFKQLDDVPMEDNDGPDAHALTGL